MSWSEWYWRIVTLVGAIAFAVGFGGPEVHGLPGWRHWLICVSVSLLGYAAIFGRGPNV
jgi:hypothetical protein